MRALLLVVVLLLAGCAKYYWTRPAATYREFERDNLGCARVALGYTEQTEAGGAFGSGAGGFRYWIGAIGSGPTTYPGPHLPARGSGEASRPLGQTLPRA
jgi:hypothetical protein